MRDWLFGVMLVVAILQTAIGVGQNREFSVLSPLQIEILLGSETMEASGLVTGSITAEAEPGAEGGVGSLLIHGMSLAFANDVVLESTINATLRGATATMTSSGIQTGAGDAATTPVTAMPPQYLGYFGHSVSSVPDTDGDDIPDAMVGGLLMDSPASVSSGAVYIYAGGTGGLLDIIYSPNAQFNGSFGYAVSGVPDVNGDGRGDYLVGAPDEDPPGGSSGGTLQPFPGRAYLFAGGPAGTASFLREFAPPVDQITGNFGVQVIGLPDVDGDNRGDVAVAAHRADTPVGDRSGFVQVFNGDSGALLYTITPPINGESQEDAAFGYSMDRVPDVNNDGIDDLIIGSAYRYTTPENLETAGAAFLCSGTDGQILRAYYSSYPRPRGITQHFGWDVAGVADTDGDGFGDIIVGAPFELIPGTGFFTGVTYLFSGNTGDLLHTFESPDPAKLQRGGNVVEGMADQNGDGYGDVAVRFNYDTSLRRVLIYNGRTGNQIASIKDTSSPYINGSFGAAIADAGDLSGDGLSDLIIGYPQARPSGVEFAGAAGFFLGPGVQAALKNAEFDLSGILEYEIPVEGSDPILGSLDLSSVSPQSISFPIIAEIGPDGGVILSIPLDSEYQIETGIPGVVITLTLRGSVSADETEATELQDIWNLS